MKEDDESMKLLLCFRVATGKLRLKESMCNNCGFLFSTLPAKMLQHEENVSEEESRL